jgi:hypothetical protein
MQCRAFEDLGLWILLLSKDPRSLASSSEKSMPSPVITPAGTEFATASEESGFTDAKGPFADPGTLDDTNCATAHLETRLPHTRRSVERLNLYTRRFAIFIDPSPGLAGLPSHARHPKHVRYRPAGPPSLRKRTVEEIGLRIRRRRINSDAALAAGSAF